MGRYHDRIDIDGEKLRTEIKKRGMTGKEVSEELGLSTGYISDCICDGKIRKIVLMGLETKFGITYEDLKKVEPVQEPVQEVVQFDQQPIIDKIDELIMTVNKLGNISMQNMEYMKQLRDLMK